MVIHTKCLQSANIGEERPGIEAGEFVILAKPLGTADIREVLK